MNISYIYGKLVKLFSGHGIGSLYPIILLDSLIVKLLKPKYVTIDGHKIFLDSQDSLRLSTNGEFEPLEISLLKKR